MSDAVKRYVVRWTAPDGETGLCLADGTLVDVMDAERANEYASGMTATSSTGTVHTLEPGEDYE